VLIHLLTVVHGEALWQHEICIPHFHRRRDSFWRRPNTSRRAARR